jgi:hypothetical protein
VRSRLSGSFASEEEYAVEWAILALVVAAVLAFLLSRPRRGQTSADDTTAHEAARPGRIQQPAPGPSASGSGPAEPRQETEPPPPPRLEDLVGPELRPLVRKLSHEMPMVAAQAARALGESGRPDAVLPLIRTLGNQQRSLRFAVVEALLKLGSHSVGPLREALKQERDPELWQLTALILIQLARMAKGLEPAPVEILLEPPPELLDEMARDLMRR